jgi:hypothetical protein
MPGSLVLTSTLGGIAIFSLSGFSGTTEQKWRQEEVVKTKSGCSRAIGRVICPTCPSQSTATTLPFQSLALDCR